MLRAPPPGTVAVMHTRRLLILLALAALAAAAIAQPASARFHQAKFLVKFDGTVHSTWNLPKYRVAQDCYRSTMFEAGGEETWHVASRGAQKVLAFSNGVATQFQIGSWQMNADTGQTGLKAKGQVNRTRHQSTTYEAGTCGITAPPLDWDDPTPPMDCGGRLLDYDVQLGSSGSAAVKLAPDVLLGEHGVREKVGFDNCTLVTPDNVLAGSWPAAEAQIMYRNKPMRNYWGTQKTFTATGHESWDASRPVETVTQTATVTIDWKLTFTRVK
jgi:hypothetical protein